MKFFLILAAILLLYDPFIHSQDAQIIGKLTDELNIKIGEMPLAEGPDSKIRYSFKFDEQSNKFTVFASHYHMDNKTKLNQRTIVDFKLSDINPGSIRYNMIEDSNQISIICSSIDNNLIIRERSVLNGELLSTTKKDNFSFGKWMLDEDWDEVRTINRLFSEAIFTAHYGDLSKNTLIEDEYGEVLVITDTSGNWRNDENTPEDEEVFTLVEQMPEYPGGWKAFESYIKNNLKHPDQKRKKKRHGKVFVNFIVEKDGSLSNPKILHSIGDEFDKETVRLIMGMPKWNPGFQRGKAERVSYNLQIKF